MLDRGGRLTLLAVLLLSLLAGRPVVAAECDGVLIPTVEIAKSDRTTELTYLIVIDKSEYEKLKSGGSAGLSIPIVEVIVKASANWSDFQERRSRYLEAQQFRYSESDSRSYLKTYLPDNVVSAWAKCMTDNAGVAVYARSVTPTTFALRLEWDPPGGVASAGAEVGVGGGTIDGKATLKTTLTGRSKASWIVTHDREADVTVVANVQGYTDDLVVRRAVLTGQAILYVARLDERVVESRQRCSDVVDTDNLHNVRCRDGCSNCGGDNKWCHTDRTFEILPSEPEWRLRPTLTGVCARDNQTSCGWNAIGETGRLAFVENGPRRIVVRRSFGSHDIGVKYCATEDRITNVSTRERSKSWPVSVGGSFVAEVPKGQTGILEVVWNDGRTEAVPVGESRGRLHLAKPPVDSGQTGLFTYELVETR